MMNKLKITKMHKNKSLIVKNNLVNINMPRIYIKKYMKRISINHNGNVMWNTINKMERIYLLFL